MWKVEDEPTKQQCVQDGEWNEDGATQRVVPSVRKDENVNRKKKKVEILKML